MADVTQPWAKRVSPDLHGHGDAHVQAPDHARRRLHPAARRARGSNYDLVIKSGGPTVERTTTRGSKDRIHFRIACRDRRTENLRITVVRRSGSGPYTLTAKYAG